MFLLRTAVIVVALVLPALVVGCSEPVDPSPSPSDAAAAVTGWQPTPASVLSARHDAAAFWTGTELIVIGGDGAKPLCPPEADCIRDAGEPLDDAAAFDPLAGTWRALSPTPMALGYVSGAVVENSLYVWAPQPPAGDGPAAFLGYEVADDRWHELRVPPEPTAGLTLVAAGSRVAAFEPTQELGVSPDLVYDTRRNDWSQLPLDPLTPAYDRTVVWTGRDLVVLGIRIDPARAPNRPPVYSAAAFDFAAGRWRRLPDSEIAGWNPSWFWTGGSIVNPTTGSGDGGQVNNWGRRYPFGGMLTPPAGTWSPLPDLPAGGAGYRGLSVAGPEHAVAAEGWVLDVPARRWLPLAMPPGAPDHGAAVAWAGDRLVVWGGVRWDGGEPTVLDTGWMWQPS